MVTTAFAQTKADSVEFTAILSSEQIASTFTEPIRKKFNINYPIWRAYKYSERGGPILIALLESADSILSNGKDTIHHHIKAISFKSKANVLTKLWEINDFIVQKKGLFEEFSIWFWTRYSALQDIDNDGIIDPVIVYGTAGLNGYDDGRIKIIVFHKGKKVAIRHQNSVLDGGRTTLIDAGFYTLPILLQLHVQRLMQRLVDNEHAIFPSGWKEAFKKKQIKLVGA